MTVAHRALAHRQAIASGANGYWLLTPSHESTHSVQVVWHDAVSAGAWSLYSANEYDHSALRDSVPASDATPDPEMWSDEAESITDPAGTAAGSHMHHFADSGAKAYLLRFLASADSIVSVKPHGKG